MTDKELRRLSRKELLEMLIDQSKEMERLQAALRTSEMKAKNREITIQTAGSIAEAALALNGIFEAAQAVADQYLLSIRHTAGLTDEQTEACMKQETEGKTHESDDTKAISYT